VVTAHTLDDQAETVVMRLLRGTGVGGLGAMRASAARDGVTLLRPLLGIAKARLVATCEREGWPYLSDPSNSDTRFARARLRGEVMPFLARHGLTAERLANLAQRARRDADALAAHAAVVLEEIARRHAPEAAPGLELDGTRLKTEPDAVLLRVIASAVAAVAGGNAPPLRLERFEARVLGDLRTALRTGAALRMNLGGALLHLRADGRIVVSLEPPRQSAKNKAFPDE
jgi:tRNA(Ile)-lysidine synthase